MLDIKNLSDDHLVDCFIKGDAAAIECLVGRYKDRLYTYIYLIVKNQELAEDIFQDAFIKVIKSLKQKKYTDNGKFASWMFRIAHNLIIDHYRRQKYMNTVSNDDTPKDLFNAVKYAEVPKEEQIVYDQLLTQVSHLIHELPAEQREVVIMRFYWDLSFKEIAEQTGVSINTSLGRMRYALMNLRKIVKQKGIALEV